MPKQVYLVATRRPWNIQAFHTTLCHYPGEWHLITKKEELTLERIHQLRPRYIFFPHWSHIVPKEILEATECVCFHETDLPFGRGGSPVQNLIADGFRETKISALRMTEALDAGPIYLKRDLSLEGLGEEVFLRSARTVASMIKEIVAKEPKPKVQKGKVKTYARRKPEESELPKRLDSLEKLFDFLRMLDAAEYPRAFLEYGDYRLEFSRPALRVDGIQADVWITKKEK